MTLTAEENERLTRVGPGTPGGELLRRYWHPVAITAKLSENPVQKVRILGEDLVLYRDKSGTLGLVGERCAHRLVHLQYGIPEARGLRCPYHGWCYDETGQCIETPLESPRSRLKDSVSIGGYPVEELGGLVFAYLGPLPKPELPRWDLFVRNDGFRQIYTHDLPCNWLQVMENRGDNGHAVYLHGELFQYVLERQGRLTDDPMARYNAVMNRHVERLAAGSYERYRAIPNEFGFTKGRLDFDQDESAASWHIGMNPVLFPYQLANGPLHSARRAYQLGVPIDDTHTWHITYNCFVFPEQIEMPAQDEIPYVECPLTDENGNYLLDYVIAQDMAAWHSQGEIADRTKETLAGSDTCVVAYRKLLAEQIDLVEAGGDPINVFRDEKQAWRPELRIPGFAEEDLPMEETVGGGATIGYYRANYHQVSKGGWLYIDDDVEGLSPDRDLIVAAFAELEELRQTEEEGASH